MRLVMLSKQHGYFTLQLFLNDVRYPQLLLDPHHHTLPEQADPQRRSGQMSFQQAFKGEQRFVVKSDAVQILNAYICFAQAVCDCMVRKLGIVFSSRKAFFLRGGDNSSIANQTRSTVVIECRNAEDIGAQGGYTP